MKREKILITSALPYANGPLHFGHIAGAYLPGDCCARYNRLCGNDVLYICGSDEYGMAITLSAQLAGRTPREHVDIYHKVIKDFFQQLNLSFDHYSRTTWKGHQEPVQQFFKDLMDNGYIEERVTEQLYSESDKRFLADRYVEGTCPECGFDRARGDECQKCGASYEATDLKNPRSKLTGAKLIRKPTNHWFLLLEKFREPLLEWLQKKQWRPNVTNFVKKYIEGLQARAITRDLDWGIPVPVKEAKGKVLYVWFDAPIGYISASQEWAQTAGTPERWKDYWLDPETKLIHFIGKDNIPFHAAIFPAMIMGQNTPYKLVDELPANEFYNLEGRQFSKSDGWFIDLEDFFKNYTPDQIRYTIAANAPETSDSEFTWNDFQNRCNGELLGKYGNLVNRTLVFAAKQCDGAVPKDIVLGDADKEFLEKARAIVAEAALCYENYRVRKASQTLMELAQHGNVYFDHKKPWQTAKSDETRKDMEATIYCCLECIKLMTLISSPIIPTTAQRVWEFLGFQTALEKESWNAVVNTPIKEGQKLGKSEILFRKVEDKEIEIEKEKLYANTKKEEPNWITIDDVKKVDLRIGKVLSADVVENSKKLLKLEVDLGNEVRQVLSGVKEFYQPSDLIGKHVVLVANLKPAKIMGMESQGMILAGHSGEKLEVLTVSSLEPGSIVS